MKNSKKSPLLWDLFCIASLVGIWPRFIEPSLIFTTRLTLPIAHLPKDLHGLKIVQISDLHLNIHTSDAFLTKLIRKCHALKPDLIAFTGDFICYGQLQESAKLKSLLDQLHAPYGCYAVLGNHDYASCISINDEGDYDIVPSPSSSSLARAFRRLIESKNLTSKTTERAKDTPLNSELVKLLEETPFKLLHNETKILSIGNTKLNLCGLGEYTLKKNNASQAYKTYDSRYPGIILMHNPDGFFSLKNYPGDIVLSGHSHGGQVNFPWMWKKFTLLENMQFKRGLRKEGNKWLYINRGLGSVLPFRWFAPPEILLLTLEQNEAKN